MPASPSSQAILPAPSAEDSSKAVRLANGRSRPSSRLLDAAIRTRVATCRVIATESLRVASGCRARGEG